MQTVYIVYSNGDYDVYYHKNGRGKRKYRIVNIRDKELHTHRYNKKECIDLINFAKHKKIPRAADIDYLTSLYRILKEGKLKNKVLQLIHVKEDKKKGNQNHFINIQKGVNKRR